MRRWIAVSLIVLLLGAAGAPTLEGEWVLTAQRYGQGGSNLADPEHPVLLRVSLAAGAPQVGVGAGAPGAPLMPWPAWVGVNGPVALDVLEREVDPSGGIIRSRYRLIPEREEDLALEVVEQYRLSDDGRQLRGALEVRFLRGGAGRGSYTLHRTFERRR